MVNRLPFDLYCRQHPESCVVIKHRLNCQSLHSSHFGKCRSADKNGITVQKDNFAHIWTDAVGVRQSLRVDHYQHDPHFSNWRQFQLQCAIEGVF